LEQDILTPMNDNDREKPLSEEKEKTSIFLICPVRDASDPINILIKNYVEEKKAAGFRVYYPKGDINQIISSGGIRICEDNRQAIENADEVHLWYDPSFWESQFYLGMAFALGKKVILANKDVGFIRPLPTECFGFDIFKEVHFFSNNFQTLEDYKSTAVISFRLDPNSKQSLFNFGMAFALKKPMKYISN